MRLNDNNINHLHHNCFHCNIDDDISINTNRMGGFLSPQLMDFVIPSSSSTSPSTSPSLCSNDMNKNNINNNNQNEILNNYNAEQLIQTVENIATLYPNINWNERQLSSLQNIVDKFNLPNDYFGNMFGSDSSFLQDGCDLFDLPNDSFES